MLLESITSTSPLFFFVFGPSMSHPRYTIVDASHHIPQSFRAQFEVNLDVRSTTDPYHTTRPPDWMLSSFPLIVTAFDRSTSCLEDIGWPHRHHGEVGVSFWRSLEFPLVISYLQCPGSSVPAATRDGCYLIVPRRCSASCSRPTRCAYDPPSNSVVSCHMASMPLHAHVRNLPVFPCRPAMPLGHSIIRFCHDHPIGKARIPCFVVAGV